MNFFFLTCYTALLYSNMGRIKTIEYFRVKPRWLFVKVTDEEGHYGWGESTLEGHTEAVEGTLAELSERFQGYEAEYEYTPTH